VKLVIIDNYDSFTFNLYQMLGELTKVPPLVFKNDELGPREIEALRPDGVILSPGPGHPREAGRMIEVIEGLDPAIPIFGVCLGHQAIVEAFGGRVIGAGVIMHGKTSEVAHEGSAIFDGVASPMVVMRYHSLAAEPATFPAALRVTSRSADGIIMALEHRSRPIYGVQFHPESIATGVGSTMLENFIEVCRRQRRGALSGDAHARTSADAFRESIERVFQGSNLSRDVARTIAERFLSGEYSHAQAGAFALAMRAKGEHEDELAGLALAVRATALGSARAESACEFSSVDAPTASMRWLPVALGATAIAAGAGLEASRTAAPGGHEAALRQRLASHVASTAAPLDAPRATLFEVEAHYPGVRRLPAWDELGDRSIFGLLRPLLPYSMNPHTIVAVPQDGDRRTVLRALRAVGTQRALVVSGFGGAPFASPAGPNAVTELRDGVTEEWVLDPRTFFMSASPAELRSSSDEDDLKVLISMFEGEGGVFRDACVLHAALGAYVAELAADMHGAIELVSTALATGKALHAVRG
jgi:anthranilate synthase/aminodeoxychorismate synthase-like glutamine amidotransferase